jgi:hypothetical protein
MRIFILLIFVAFVLVLPVSALGAAGGVKGTTVALVPTSGPAGSTVLAEGFNYPRDTQGTITFDGQVVGTFTVEKNRTWGVYFVVPADATAGQHTVTATAENGATDSATFTVTG